MFVVLRPRMFVERVQFALVEQLVVGRLMTAERIGTNYDAVIQWQNLNHRYTELYD